MSLANQLTVQTLKALSLKGYHVWRQNNGGVYDPVKKVFRRNSSTPGVSDIIGFHKKRLFSLAFAFTLKPWLLFPANRPAPRAVSSFHKKKAPWWGLIVTCR